MKKAEVKIGETYHAKVSGHLVKVQVVAARPTEGWTARNKATGRDIYVRSAQRLHPLPPVLQFFLDEQAGTREIARAEAVSLVHDLYGVGTWLDNLRRARRPEGLELRGGQVLRARANCDEQPSQQ